MTFKSIIILSCFIANMEQDIFLDMFFAFFFAVSENLFTFAAIKGSHWRNLPKVLSRVAVISQGYLGMTAAMTQNLSQRLHFPRF